MPIKTPAKRLLPLVLILIFAVPSFGQTLLFKTGFEPNTHWANGTAIGSNAVPCTSYSSSVSIFVDFAGTDNSTGFTFPIKPFSWGSNTGIRVDSDNGSGTYCNHFDDRIITSGCHSGSQCLQLKMYNYPNGQCCPQQPVGETNLSAQPINEFYERFWLKYDSSYNPNNGGYSEDSIIYLKTLDDYRMEPNIWTDPSHSYVLHGHAQADAHGIRADNAPGCQMYDPVTFTIIATANCPTWFDWADNTEHAITTGTWHLVEFYLKRSHNPDGRLAVAIDGHVVTDSNIINYGIDKEEIQDFGFLQHYGYIFPSIKYIDDWEIWSTIPCTTFPCQSVTGAGGGPATTPPPLTRFPQTSYSGIECTVNVSCSYQMTAINNPTSFSTGGCSLPPGMSLNTSTGVISGTPTSAGTYGSGTSLCTFTISNASGVNHQYLFFHVNSSLQKPKIPYFWASGSTLKWITTGTNVSLSIDNGVGTVSGPNGSISVNNAATYTLTASNSAGSTSTTVLGAAAQATVSGTSVSSPSPPTGLTATVN